MSFLQAYNAWCNCVLFKPLQQSLKAKGSESAAVPAVQLEAGISV